MKNESVRSFAYGIVNFFVGLVEIFLGLRFLLKLFGANPNTDFVAWIYDMSAPLLAPFRGIFPTEVFENQYVLEFSTLFAMLIYALVAVLVVALLDAMTPNTKVVKK